MEEEASEDPSNCLNAPLIFLDWCDGDAKPNVQATCPYLPTSVELVGQFHFAEGDGSFHPMGSKVGGVGMDVDTAVAGDLGFARRHPLAIDVLPTVTVRGHKIQQEGVHGIRVQPRDADL